MAAVVITSAMQMAMVLVISAVALALVDVMATTVAKMAIKASTACRSFLKKMDRNLRSWSMLLRIVQKATDFVDESLFFGS